MDEMSAATVWLVKECPPFEGDTVEGVFSSLDLARRAYPTVTWGEVEPGYWEADGGEFLLTATEWTIDDAEGP